MRRSLAPLIALGLVLGGVVAAPAGADRSTDGPRLLLASRPARQGPLTAVQRAALRGETLTADPVAHHRAKVAADERARAAHAPAGAAPSGGPTVIRSFRGVNDPSYTPSDSTGAIGPRRYVELVNSRYAIYARGPRKLLSTGTLAELGGSSTVDSAYDPQIIWDPGTARFFYAMDDIVDADQNDLLVGFSKTAAPSSPADFCHYAIPYGAELPDAPKLGDSREFLLLGVNILDGFTSDFLRTDLVALTKPPPGTTCPSPGTFGLTIARDLRNADAESSVAMAPTPANQTDTLSTGHVLATRSGGADFISVFRVTRGADGEAVVRGPRTMPVEAYSVPEEALQPGSIARFRTGDARLGQAVSAIDPTRGHGGRVAIWAQHTVFGGVGAEVRWYEIDPTGPVAFQTGRESSPTTYHFNGAIAPDRRVQAGSGHYGSSMALTYNRSGSSRLLDIVAVSRTGEGPTSGPTVIKVSDVVVDDNSCNNPGRCRWGNHAGATPDPASPTDAQAGQVWFTNAWSEPGEGIDADWRTWNFAVRPASR